jgi:uncharacterized DUF497 family protein
VLFEVPWSYNTVTDGHTKTRGGWAVPRRGARRRHPSEAEVWSRNEGNESELAAHGISFEEVEQVFANAPRWAANRRARSGDWKMLGLTDGGRRLTIVLHYDGLARIIRPITGWSPTAGELTRYFEGWRWGD